MKDKKFKKLFKPLRRVNFPWHNDKWNQQKKLNSRDPRIVSTVKFIEEHNK